MQKEGKVVNQITAMFERVKALVPEADSLTINIAMQDAPGLRPFQLYTIIVQDGPAYMGHASAKHSEDEAVSDCMRQVNEYRVRKASAPCPCPTCGHHGAPAIPLTDLRAECVGAPEEGEGV